MHLHLEPLLLLSLLLLLINFPDCMVKHLKKDMTLHKLVLAGIHAPSNQPPMVLVLSKFKGSAKQPPALHGESIQHSSTHQGMFTLTPGGSLEELEELRCCTKSLNLYKVKSGLHIMAHFQHPTVKQAIRIIVCAYTKQCPFLKSAYNSDQPLSWYILALAAVKVSISAYTSSIGCD